METYAILYLEINIISVLLVGIIRYKTLGLTKMVAQRNFSVALDSTIVFSLSDTFYVMMKCGILPFTRIGVMTAKELYFFSTTLMCFFWFMYFEYMQDSPFVKNRKRVLIASAFVWVMGILLVVNLFSGVLFYVDDAGQYQRGPLFIIQYFLSYTYVFFSSLRALIGLIRKDSRAQKEILLSLVLFPVAPAMAGIIQFIRPELPLACIAVSISALIMYLNWLDQMISMDPLTHLSNRKRLSYSYEHGMHDLGEGKAMFLMIIDANGFKQINDTYGHIQGDAALVRIADALRLSCSELHCRTNIARYGGDEFVVLVWADDDAVVYGLRKRIHENLKQLNGREGVPYQLTVSIGVAKASRGLSIKARVDEADRELYEEKAQLKR